MSSKIARRNVLKWGAVLGGALIFPLTYTGRRKEYQLWAKDLQKNGRFFGYEPFDQPLYIPPVLTSKPFGVGFTGGKLDPKPSTIFDQGPLSPDGKEYEIVHGIAPEFGLCTEWNDFSSKTHEKEYLLITEETTQHFIPGGPDTPVFTYRDGFG